MSIGSIDVERIRSLPIFTGMTPRILNDVLADAAVRVYPKGMTLFVQGDEVDRFFVVLTGWVRLYRVSADGRVTTLEVFGPGESFAEGAMHMADGYPASAETVEPGRLLEIPTASFLRRLRADPDLAVNMMCTMAIRLKTFVNRLEQAGTLSAPQRVASFLLRYHDDDDAGAGEAVIALPYDKQLVASRLGMTPETFSRALMKLREIGVTTDANRVSIENVASLRRFAEPDN